MKLSIVYVNYNTEDLLIDSLASLKKNLKMKPSEYEVLVVDNASRELNKDRILKVFKGTRIYPLKDNMGFGGGNNVGVSHARGEYVWLLNTDTIIPIDNRMHELIDFLNNNKKYAAASPLLTDRDGNVQPSQVDRFPTLYRLLLIKPMRLLVNRIVRRTEDVLFDQDVDVDVAVAAAFVVSRKVYQQVGGFDSRYFMYYEDTDLCRKIYGVGYRIRFIVTSHVIHLWGRSISSSSDRKRYYYESQNKYFYKWHGFVSVVFLWVFRMPLYVKNVIFEGIHERKDT